MNSIRKTCAVDFDGTLCYDNFPFIGNPRYEIIDLIKRLKSTGWAIILWTNREGQLLKDAVEWCNNIGIELDAINANLPERTAFYGNDCRKIGADIYIDDKAINPLYNISELMNMLSSTIEDSNDI